MESSREVLRLRLGTLDTNPHVDAAIVQVEAGVIAVGDTLHLKGHTTDFVQRVDRIELEHREIPIAHPGQIIGAHVSERVREHDEVLKQ